MPISPGSKLGTYEVLSVLGAGGDVRGLPGSRHAPRAGALDPAGREALLRYVLRPPVAQERVEQRPDGLVRITLKKAYPDGTTAVEIDPLSLLCRLATSVPPSRFHTVKYAGVLAPASPWRRPAIMRIDWRTALVLLTLPGQKGQREAVEWGAMATAAKAVYPHITKNPEICSGRACVAGTRVRVMDIVALRGAGVSPEEIVQEFPSLESTIDVYAALVYYADHKDEIDADFAEDQDLAAKAERERIERARS
jgi:uncharacterized protein (DUF433 family)